ncbi:DNA polymerase III subunit gamma/tau [uncultured Psychrosphaera sp.]|uniref:DNA polymerase III subunit gamma/tau n=1 Tax=uncultured Psychrosphaera sp. TaxID=1403522 RepID=UPI002633C3D3|nr:DNA polymerase III subunit gamma/tau [uncultured Psychrosphaera sp.]
MSYQVLARKWRPAKFAELVGQEHVKAALINGLTNQRLHHAYLFTGTRGVGKTTIARIFAKSLNCETGISAEPCGQCGTCLDVDAGRFVDLIEIDAASRTKVGDTREILDNVQYAPTRGRYKVYLIDEVHMLSRHSFNALLKTLEEPPEHVKFLLATTDPQKLPVTILSRCLQFNLQALSIKQISEQLVRIMQAEQLPFEQEALELLAKYAKGSMRDGLSLTDQAIAQSGQNVTLDVVQHMMGTVDISWSQNILAAILNSDADGLVSEFSRLTKQNPDIEKVLDDLLSVCHQIALTQIMPNAAQLNQNISEFIKTVATKLTPQEVQVYYQILLQGKRDLKISSDPYASFEMICLRMLAFKPVTDFSELPLKKNSEINIPRVETPVSEPLQKLAQKPVLKEVVSPEPELIEQPAKPVIQDATTSAGSQTLVANVTDATNEITEDELLAQQNFYQDMAQSQGFEGQSLESNDFASTDFDSRDFENQVEPTQAVEEQSTQTNTPETEIFEPLIDSDELDSPVMAILAARGFDGLSNTELNPDLSKVTPAEQKTKNKADENTQASVTEPTKVVEEIILQPKAELMPLEHEEVRYAHEVDSWASLIERSNLAGRAKQLALNGSVDITDDRIELVVKQEFMHLLNEKTEAELNDVVLNLAPQCKFVIKRSESVEAAPAEIQKDINQNRQQRAEESINADPMVQTLVQEFDGRIVAGSIKPL